MNQVEIEERFTFRKGVRDNENLRASFNALARKVYGFDFVTWYDSGYWCDRYCPYVLVEGDTIVANVSANRMVMLMNGIEKHFIQIGTVMTEESYRRLGLGRYLMEKVIEDWEGRVDGFFLFANDSAIDFYPKFGFRECEQYQYGKSIDVNTTNDSKKYLAEQLDMMSSENQRRLYEAVRSSKINASLQMLDYPELVLFYALMGAKVFYIEELDIYVIAEIEGSTLDIMEVFGEKEIPIEDLVASIATADVKQVKLGFTPINRAGYDRSLLKCNELTLFIRGEVLDKVEKEELMFPELSHA